MPRAPRARQPDIAERIRLFAEHHIVAVRTGRRNGEIIAVKHATMGWITPQAYYGMQKAHDFLPLLEKVIESGYRMKLALGSMSVLGVDLGVMAYGGALGLAILDISNGEVEEAQILSLGVFAPFGEVLLLIVAALKFAGVPVNWSTVLGTLSRFLQGKPGVFAGAEPGLAPPPGGEPGLSP